MSYIRLNITDQKQTIHTEVHGSFSDVILAALTAEPETIEELNWALERFTKFKEGLPILGGFTPHENFEPYDAGIMVVDLAGRVIAAESTYSLPSYDGSVFIHPDVRGNVEEYPEDVFVPYMISRDWLIVHGMPEFKGVSRSRREARMATPPLDTRSILYGKPMLEFIVQEIFSSDDLADEALFSKIHERWLMTSREDLRGHTPREIIFEKRKFIDFDLHSRAVQWSFTERCPAPLLTDSRAYKFSGYGTHEWVIYYDLIRHLLSECLSWRQSGKLEIDAISYLTTRAANWMESAQREYSGRVPAHMIDWERRRMNITMSAHEGFIDDNCPTCIAMLEDTTTPMFWHLDGCNMDEGFAFSYQQTLAEYEAEEKDREEFNRKFNEDWAARKLGNQNSENGFWTEETDERVQ
jgi:hypothetical protein